MEDKKNHSYYYILAILWLFIHLIWIAYSYYFLPLSGDEGLFSLMSLHWLHGDFIWTPWGQTYGGTLDSILMLPITFLMGNSIITSRLFYSIIFLLFCYGFFIFSKKYYNDLTALFVLLFLTISPAYLNIASLQGFVYLPAMTASIVLFMLMMKLLHDPMTPSYNMIVGIALGMIGGLYFWNHFLIAPALLSIAVFILISKPKSILNRWCWGGLVGFVLGVIPLGFQTIHYKYSNFKMSQSIPFDKIFSKIIILFQVTIPGLLGIQLPTFHDNPYWIHWPNLVYICLSLIWIFLIISGYFHPIKNNRIKIFLSLFFVIHLWVVAQSGRSTSKDTRYLMSLYIPLISLASMGLSYWKEKCAFICYFCMVFLLGFHLVGQIRVLQVWNNQKIKEENLHIYHPSTLYQFMDANNIKGVYTRYMFAYPFTYLSNESIIFSPIWDERFGRHRPFYVEKVIPYFRKYVEQRKDAAILVNDHLGMSEHYIKNRLDMNHISYQTYRVNPFTIFYHFKNHSHYDKDLSLLPQENFSLSSNFNSSLIHLATDQNLSTYWHTSHPQTSDMFIQIDLHKNKNIGAIRIHQGRMNRDFPRKLLIQSSLDGVMWKDIFSLDKPGKAIQMINGHMSFYESVPIILAKFHPVNARYFKLLQTGTDSYFYWSVSELDVYEVVDS